MDIITNKLYLSTKKIRIMSEQTRIIRRIIDDFYFGYISPICLYNIQ